LPFISHIGRSNKICTSKAIEDAYEAGRNIKLAYANGMSGGDLPSVSFSSMSYDKLTSTSISVETSTTSIINNITLQMSQSDSDTITSLLNKYGILATASS